MVREWFLGGYILFASELTGKVCVRAHGTAAAASVRVLSCELYQ